MCPPVSFRRDRRTRAGPKPKRELSRSYRCCRRASASGSAMGKESCTGNKINPAARRRRVGIQGRASARAGLPRQTKRVAEPAEEAAMRHRIGILGLVVFAIAARASAGTMVTYPSGSETVSGYLAAPEGSGKKPAIVVIHEWWGLNDWVKGRADAFAKQGYVALAVDLYRGKVATDADMAHQLMRGVPDDRAVRDMKAAVAYLRTRPEVDGSKIASIGWCWGGGMSLDLAVAEPTLAGAVIY